MAVAKIRKISNTVLLAIAVITVVVFGAFIFGGYVDPTAAKPEPKFTGVLLGTSYSVLAITVLVLIAFAILGFVRNLKDNPKGALGGLLGLVALIALFVVTYAIGGTDPLALSADFQKYNTNFYLKMSDMWLYSVYVMLALSVVALIWGGVRSTSNRSK